MKSLALILVFSILAGCATSPGSLKRGLNGPCGLEVQAGRRCFYVDDNDVRDMQRNLDIQLHR